MNRLSLWLMSGLLLAGGQNLNAQSPDSALNLQAVLQYGLANSLSIRQAANDLQKTEYQIKEIRSSGLPQLSAEGQFQHFVNRPTQLLPGEIIGQPGTQIPVQFGTNYNVSGTIKASQLLYNQELISGLRIAESSRELYRLLKIKTEEDAVYQISVAYYQCLQLEAQLSVLDSNLQMLDKMSELLKLRVENSMVTKTDLNRIRVQRANLLNQRNQLETGMQQQGNYLKLLIGMPIQDTLTLKEFVSDSTAHLTSLEQASAKVVDLKILEKQMLIEQQSRQAIQAGYYPTLALFGQQAWQAQRNEFDFFQGNQPWFQQTLWGLSLQVPIFDGGTKHYKVQQSKIASYTLDLKYLNAQRQLDMAQENAKKQLINSMEAVQVQKENKQLAKEVYDQTQSLYKEQVTGLTELLQSEQAYREAQTYYYKEMLNYKVAELDLLKAQGQLNTIIH
ncbi:MAG: TolC family protein [Bacteroidetes bacterium]|nr:MAG: TolC family protein [Bacteroidota bacterium]